MNDVIYLDLARHRVSAAAAALETARFDSRYLADQVAWQSPTAERFRVAAAQWCGDVEVLVGHIDALEAALLGARARAELLAGAA